MIRLGFGGDKPPTAYESEEAAVHRYKGAEDEMSFIDFCIAFWELLAMLWSEKNKQGGKP